AQWNNGWDYRNDGVDIEESQDPRGYPYNVGWIEDNEWLRYTVDISDSGKYNVDLRVASAVGGGECRLYLNNQPLGNIINISNTGGWQNWQTVNGPDLQLPAGTHQIIISFPKGGFNLNQMAFAAESTEINHHNGPYPRDYELKQNYPNPFNAGTKIQYYIPVEDEVRLTVYDTTGREVWVLVNKKQPAGDHSIIFQDSRLSSGVYICFLKTDRYQQSRKMVLMK
ncbi:MAG: carbohydrate-binding protein, partial [Calditrichaeota bacterium]